MIPNTNMSHGVPKFHLLPVKRDPQILRTIQQVSHNSVPLDPVYNCAPIHSLNKNLFRDARARGNEGDRLLRPAELLSAEQRADTDGDVHPSGSLPQSQGQAIVSVMPILTLEEDALTLRISTVSKQLASPESAWVKAWRRRK